jgi:hypothetical protein
VPLRNHGAGKIGVWAQPTRRVTAGFVGHVALGSVSACAAMLDSIAWLGAQPLADRALSNAAGTLPVVDG